MCMVLQPKRQYAKNVFGELSVTAKMGAVACGNKGVICTADFIQPMLPNDHIEYVLAAFENMASFKAWPRGCGAGLVQPFLTQLQGVYRLQGSDRDDCDRYEVAIQVSHGNQRESVIWVIELQ